MRHIERVLTYLGIALMLIYIFYGHDWELYFLILIGIMLYTFKFLNYKKLRNEIKLMDPLIIPIRNKNALYKILSIVILFGAVGLIYYLDYNKIIKQPHFNSFDSFVFTFAFPVLSIVAYIKFSDLSNKYLLTNNALISGFRFNDSIKWNKFDSFVVNNNEAIIRLQKENKVILKMKIEPMYFNENIDKIKNELKIRINMA